MGDCCSSNNGKKNKTYYYISANVTRYMEVPMVDLDKEDDHNGLPLDNKSPDADEYKPKNFHERNGKKVIPLTSSISYIHVSLRGFFVPSVVESELKARTSGDDVGITFVREMSEEEYIADREIRTAQKEFEENKGKLPNSVASEIESMIGRCEEGKLRPDTPAKDDHANSTKFWNPLEENTDDLFE